MNNNSSNYNVKYVNTVIKHLYPADLQKADMPTLPARIEHLAGKISIGLKRFKQALQEKKWYGEAHARQLVIEYINNPQCRQQLQSQHNKISAIYERLAHISHGKGTWADGIDKELLETHESADHKPGTNTNDKLIHELEELITGDIFIPESPEEKLFDATVDKVSKKSKDSRYKSYKFEPIADFKSPTDNLLFHIHADEFGSSSQLEGGHSEQAVHYLKQFLCGANKSHSKTERHYSQELIEELDTGHQPSA